MRERLRGLLWTKAASQSGLPRLVWEQHTLRVFFLPSCAIVHCTEHHQTAACDHAPAFDYLQHVARCSLSAIEAVASILFVLPKRSSSMRKCNHANGFVVARALSGYHLDGLEASPNFYPRKRQRWLDKHEKRYAALSRTLRLKAVQKCNRHTISPVSSTPPPALYEMCFVLSSLSTTPWPTNQKTLTRRENVVLSTAVRLLGTLLRTRAVQSGEYLEHRGR